MWIKENLFDGPLTNKANNDSVLSNVKLVVNHVSMESHEVVLKERKCILFVLKICKHDFNTFQLRCPAKLSCHRCLVLASNCSNSGLQECPPLADGFYVSLHTVDWCLLVGALGEKMIWMWQKTQTQKWSCVVLIHICESPGYTQELGMAWPLLMGRCCICPAFSSLWMIPGNFLKCISCFSYDYCHQYNISFQCDRSWAVQSLDKSSTRTLTSY